MVLTFPKTIFTYTCLLINNLFIYHHEKLSSFFSKTRPCSNFIFHFKCKGLARDMREYIIVLQRENNSQASVNNNLLPSTKFYKTAIVGSR